MDNSERHERVILDLVVDSWRFTRLFIRAINRMDSSEAGRYQSSVRFHVKRLEEALAVVELRLVSLEGLVYDAGMAASALNLADFAPGEALVVEQMVEPVIMGPDGVRRLGTMILTRQGAAG